MEYFTVATITAEINRREGVDISPQIVSHLFYRKKMPESLRIREGKTTLIRRTDYDAVVAVLRKHTRHLNGPKTRAEVANVA